MLARIVAISATTLIASPAPAQSPNDLLTRPIVTDRTVEWLAPRTPLQIFGNSYLVGFGGLSVVLIDTGHGLILIDGALPQAASAILANVTKLGFRPRDIKYVLSTEPHFDHAGGLAALARDTGAIVVASLRGAEGLRSGRLAADDPQHDYDSRFPPVTTVRTIDDGETLRLGDVLITARATPGHTMGSMSWSWRSCEARHCRAVVFASSLNPVSAERYRYNAPSSRDIVAGFHRSYAVMKKIPCDILITAHPDQGKDAMGFAAAPGACRAYANQSKRALVARLSKERERQASRRLPIM